MENTPLKKVSFLITVFVMAFCLLPASSAEEAASGEETSSTVMPSEEKVAELAETPPAESQTASSDAKVVEGSFTALSGPEEAVVDQTIVPGKAGLNEQVSLDLRNIEVSEALKFLAQKAGMNLVISKNVSGRVQLLLNNVPIKDIFDILLISNSLAYEKHGEVYNIMTEDEFKARFGRKFSDTREVKVFRLKYAAPDQAFAMFEVLKSEIGRFLVDPETGTVLVMDTPENIARMEQALEGLEMKRHVKVYSLKYAKAVEVETRLKTQLDNKKVGLISADERTNQVIVETYSGRMEDIDALITSLDRKTREVLIDAKIVKILLTDNLDAEIKWEGIFTDMAKYGTQYIGSHPFSPIFRTGQSAIDDFAKIAPTARPTAGDKSELTGNLVLGAVDNNQAFEALIKFLKTLGDTRVLSNPKLAVTENQEAKIHVGEKQAYVTTTTTSGQTTTTTAESVTFIDVGIKLSVTPTINEDGFVTMKIKPEVSNVVSFLTTPSGNKIPIVDTSLAETSVMVKDGVSIIIGGLRKEETVEERRKVPFLGDVPILGLPFNSFTNKKTHSELMIVLTPHIVYGDQLVDEGRLIATTPYMSYTDYSNQPISALASKESAVKGAVRS